MTKTTSKTTGILLMVILLIYPSSCKKYDEGPWFSIYSKMERITGNWKFRTVMEDEIDITEDFVNHTLNILRSKDLQWVQGYFDSRWNTYGPVGKWSFVNDKMQLEMHFTSQVKEEFTLTWDIIRLSFADLHLERYEGEKKIEWKLWKL